MVSPFGIGANALDIIGLLASTAAIDIVGIYDAGSFEQLATDARPVEAYVRESSRVMSHPLENGAIVSDYRIILQNEITLNLLVPSIFFSSTYQQLKNVFTGAQLLTVQTKTGVYNDMIIAEMPHKEAADMFDAVIISVKMTQVLYASLQPTYAPAPASAADPFNANYADETRRGQVTSSDAPAGSSQTFGLL